MNAQERIRRLLQHYGWSTARLAKESGLPCSTIRRVLTSGEKIATSTLEAIAKGFGFTLTEFCSDDSILIDGPKQVLCRRIKQMDAAQCKIVLKLIAAMDRLAENQRDILQ